MDTTQPKFSIGERVLRNDGNGSTILDVQPYNCFQCDDKYIYYISYDEGETPGTQNEGKGWWIESSLMPYS
jgi:hypothetical protein